MDGGNETTDFIKLVNIKGNVENITPHKIAVVAFIREYSLLKMEGIVHMGNENVLLKPNYREYYAFVLAKKKVRLCGVSPYYRKHFCMLALKLIQCPDMEFKELESLLTDGRYNLLSVHLQNFCVRLQNIYVNGISALMDCVTSTVDKLMIEQSETIPSVISRYSVLGLYLRRIVLHLDKLTFVQVGALYKAFRTYYQKGRPGQIMRYLSKEKLDFMDSQVGASPVVSNELKTSDLSLKLNAIERDNTFEECQWSRKQAELFTAQQAMLLQINESKAMHPKQLQKTIMQIINDIPEYPDVHFLSFLNCIRMKEFCGAQDSLYNCFDRSVFTISNNANASTEKNKTFRYAALNRAAMHTQFGHNGLAMEAVREAISRGQEAGDSACVCAARAWGARAGGRARRAALLARAPRHPRHAAAAAQLMAQHAALNGSKPVDVFQIISKGDSLNYLHSMTDLTVASLANSAALWGLYGKTEMASVNYQLLLNLNTKCGVGGQWVWHWTEGWAAGVAGAGGVAAWRGDAALAPGLAEHMRSAPAALIATRAHAQFKLRQGKWEEAEQSIKQLASSDRWESQLLRAEMYFLRGDAMEAQETLQDILDFCKTEDDCLHFMTLRLQAMILLSQVQHLFSNVQCTNIIMLNEALSLARKYYLIYMAATTEMHIANVQLSMGCSKNALTLVRKALPVIMAHGSAYDMARALLLYTKCRVATAPTSGEARTQVILSCCETLDTVKKNFSKVGANLRLMHTWYLQAQLYNDVGNHPARNQCAWMYRQLETQIPFEPSNNLLVMY